MDVTLDEIWALAKEHARNDGQMLPTVHPDSEHVRNVRVEGFEAKFHIYNEPEIYYTLGEVEDLVYVDTESAEQNDSMTGPYVGKEKFKRRVKNIAKKEKERRS